MPYNARPYQSDAVSSAMSHYHQGNRQMLLHLPTGAGKTVIATLIIEKFLQLPGTKKILFLAHRKEIIDQTAEKIAFHLGDIVSIEQGNRKATDSKVVIASVSSLAKRLNDFSRNDFSVIICDECHHIYAKTWLDTVAFFNQQETTLIGFSATPKRTDGRESEDYFGETVFSISLDRLQDLDFLVPIEYFTAEANLGLEQVKMNQGDFQTKSLGVAMNTPETRILTLKAWQEQGFGKKTIAFCASVSHANSLAAEFDAIGVKCASISGYTRDRDQVLEAFRTGKLEMITNFGVLTEGFDDPGIECVLLARPTTSPLVYTQCLGRGLRTHPGKKSCTVIDIIDRSTHQLQYNVYEATGLKRTWKSKSNNPLREATALSRIKVDDPTGFIKLKQANSLEEAYNILMSLPRESVIAGIDGDRHISYNSSTEKMSLMAAIIKCEKILGQFDIFTHSTEVVNDKLLMKVRSSYIVKPFIEWHLGNATGWKCNIKVEDMVRVSDKEFKKLKRTNPKGEIIKLSQKKKIDALNLTIDTHIDGFLARGSMMLDGKYVTTIDFYCYNKKGAEQAACEALLLMFTSKVEKFELENSLPPKKTKLEKGSIHTLLQKKVILDFQYEFLGEDGPAHSPIFKYEAWLKTIDHHIIKSGSVAAASKREAQKMAAERLYIKYKKEQSTVSNRHSRAPTRQRQTQPTLFASF